MSFPACPVCVPGRFFTNNLPGTLSIVARVDELMGLCERLEQSLKRAEEKSEKIFNAIVHHLQTTGKSFS